jgi:tetratricopeptide (TPR) repeat protein
VNPYCEAPLVLGTTVIDYSQPTVVVERETLPEEPLPADDPVVSQAMTQFELAREAFARGDYNAALQATHGALEQLPDDVVLHEFLALVHFAQGNYRDAAGTIHAVLAAGPGWNWETMSSLYSDVSVYTNHLRAAEAYRRENPESAYVRFLLAYHYMTTDYDEAAAGQLRQVLSVEPGDTLAAHLLQELTGETPPSEAPAAAPEASHADQPESQPERTAGSVPESLVGSWTATRDGLQFSLTLTENDEFTWTFTQGDQTKEVSGTYSLSDGLLVLESEEGDTRVGQVRQIADDRFEYRLAGVPEDEPGLLFEQ